MKHCKYDISIILSYYLSCLYLSRACAIELDDQVILTGGGAGGTRVDVYNMNGLVREMPILNIARSNHGCGHYTNSDDKIVKSMKDNH